MEKYELLEYKPKDAKDFIKTFMANNPKAGLRKTVQIYGLLSALDELGVREFRNTTSKFGNRQWYSIKKDLGSYKLDGIRPDYMANIQEQLNKFERVSIKEYRT